MSAEKVTFSIISRSELSVVLPTAHYPGAVNEEDRIVSNANYGLDEYLRTGTTPLPAEALVVAITLGGSPYSFDLTAAPIIGADLAGVPAATEDLTGNKLFHFEAQTPSTNAADITLDCTVSNGYLIFGTGNDLVLPKDSKIAFTCLSSSMPTIGVSLKAIDVSGTSGDKCNIIMGFE